MFFVFFESLHNVMDNISHIKKLDTRSGRCSRMEMCISQKYRLRYVNATYNTYITYKLRVYAFSQHIVQCQQL